MLAQIFQDILGALQLQTQLAVALFKLLVGDRLGTVVGNRSRFNDNIHLRCAAGDLLKHLLGGLYLDRLNKRPGLQRRFR